MNGSQISPVSALRALSVPAFRAAAIIALISGGHAALANEPALGIMLQVGANGLCLDNAGSARAGTGLQGWKCSARNLNQRFERVWLDKNFSALKHKRSGLCLDAGNGSGKSGAGVFQTRCAYHDSQSLQILPLPVSPTNRIFQVRARSTGLCLQLEGNIKRGGRLTQSRCDRQNPAQQFSFRP
tara:strand:- start:6567 stop:7118 length:552 start_codon:yes stop_codon:yes gene_type:complete